MELIDIYKDNEKYLGKVSSERDALQKEKEELEEKLRATQSFVSPQQLPYAQPYQQQPVAAAPRPDPRPNFEERFSEDPAKATLERIEYAEKSLTQSQGDLLQAQRAEAARQYFERQKKDNPDYLRREPLQVELARRYGHMIKDEYAKGSVELMELLDFASRGADIPHYEKTAVEKARAEKVSVTEEKRQAFSESSHSEGEQSTELDDLSYEDLERLVMPKNR